MTTTTTNQLNDVEIATVGSLIDACRREPTTAETVWSATVHWKGGFASEAKVRDFDPIASDLARDPGVIRNRGHDAERLGANRRTGEQRRRTGEQCKNDPSVHHAVLPFHQ